MILTAIMVDDGDGVGLAAVVRLVVAEYVEGRDPLVHPTRRKRSDSIISWYLQETAALIVG